MNADIRLAQIQALIEEELGEIRAFADFPSTDLEAISARLTSVVSPFVVDGNVAGEVSEAA